MKNYNQNIEKYLKGELNNKEIIEFENEMEQNEFLKISVQGYLENPELIEKKIKNPFLKDQNKEHRLTTKLFIPILVAATILTILWLKFNTKILENNTNNKISQITNQEINLNSLNDIEFNEINENYKKNINLANQQINNKNYKEAIITLNNMLKIKQQDDLTIYYLKKSYYLLNKN